MSARDIAALHEAMDVFTALGWDSCGWEDIPTAPLGTPEQRSLALAGFRNGDLVSVDVPGAGREEVEDRRARAAIFAIRQGVTATQAVDLTWYLRAAQTDALVAAAIERGEAFARTLVRRLCTRSNRFGETNGTTFAVAIVRLAEHFTLDVEQNPEYLRDFVVVAAHTFGRLGRDEARYTALPTLDVIQPRFERLVAAAVAAGAPSEGAVTRALGGGLERGWTTRERSIDLAVAGLDAATKTNQRRGWFAFLTGELAITDAETLAHCDALLPAFSSGDGPLIRDLLVRLIPLVPEAALTDLALAGSTARSRAVRAAVLTAFAARPVPADDDVAATVLEIFADAITDSDAKVAREAARLRSAWGASAPVAAPTATTLWRPSPAVWKLPRFEMPTGGLDELLRLTSVLVARKSSAVDVETERFLALANSVAATDRDGLRRVWQGVAHSWLPGLVAVWDWTRGDGSDVLNDKRFTRTPLDAREGAVFQRLGDVPVLLSTPTWVDLRIDPAELLSRLETYAAAGVAASEGDLFLAVMRTDPRLATPALITACEAVAVEITGRGGERFARTAGEVVASWLAEPLIEPELILRRGDWRPEHEAVLVPAFDGLPRRISQGPFDDVIAPETLPWWGAVADLALGDGRRTSDFGLRVRQRVLSASPLSSAFGANLLYAASASPASDRDIIATAAIDAFERGLLPPGHAGAQYLNGEAEPRRLAAFAAGAQPLVEEGLLSVLWPFFDDVLVRSAAAARPYSGSAEVADFLLANAPAVRSAVTDGQAAAQALEMPGLRAFAERGGSSRAPRAARLALEALGSTSPPVKASPVSAPAVTLDDSSFAAGWDTPPARAPYIPDGVGITVLTVPTHRQSDAVALDLALPGEPGAVFRVQKHWWYDLGHEGQCQVERRGEDGTTAGGYLRWVAESGQVVVSPDRQWWDTIERSDDGSNPVPPWSVSLTAAALTLVLHDGNTGTEGVPGLTGMLRAGRAHPDAVRDASRVLLASDQVVPSRLTRVIDKDPGSLSTLWPVISEAIRFAADAPKLPRWLARVLETAVSRAAHLAEATRRDLIPGEAWEPLTRLAAQPGSAAGLQKARALAAVLAA